MSGLSPGTPNPHHNLSPAFLACEDKCVHQLMTTIAGFTNPFTVISGALSNSDLYNLVTKVVMPENIKDDLCQQSEIGRNMFRSFVDDRVKSGKVNLWSTIKKRKLQTWKSNGKAIKVKVADKVLELKEDRSLFTRLMMVCKSRPGIDIKEAVGIYEFSVVPRSLFAADGTMLHCSCKSTLMHILEKLQTDISNSVTSPTNATSSIAVMKVSIVDGMAEVQSLDKPDWI